jgi:class 3 adenylate cyclase/tetratricopeptide (TPR) repeat protein
MGDKMMSEGALMTDNAFGEHELSPQPTDQKTDTSRVAVLFAGVAPSQSGQNFGYSEGVRSIKEGREIVLQTVTQRGGTIVRTTDESVLACFTDPVEAVKAAISMQKSSADEREKKRQSNIRIAIHYGRGTVADNSFQGEVAVFASEATRIGKVGHVYVSAEVYHNLGRLKVVEFRPVRIQANLLSSRSAFYDVVWHEETDCGSSSPGMEGKGTGGTSTFFVHGAALKEGSNSPCFYCGSKRHPAFSCPSKHLSYRTRGLEGLGYLPMEEINRLFSQYLSQAGTDLPVIPEPLGKEKEDLLYLAPWSFYELKRVFQIRFMNLIWNAAPKEDWHKLREGKREGSHQGGMLWLARDCIRTSDLDEAESLLARYGRQNPRDYRVPCGLGFVKMERGNYLSAADFFTEAINQETNQVQKTYMFLLLSRIYELIAAPDKAQDMVREALSLEPYCPEAKFEEVIGCFRLKRQNEALSRLLKLIHISREFYTAALISPELASFQPVIVPELHKLAAATGAEARDAAEEAEKKVAGLKDFLSDGDEDFAQVISMQVQMAELLARPEAFLNYYDTLHLAERITAACGVIERERKEQLTKVVRKLEERAIKLVQPRMQIEGVRSVLRPVFERLRAVTEGLEAGEPFPRCLERCEEISKELDSVEVIVTKMEARARLLLAWGRFFKDIIVVFSIAATAALVLFPGAVRCLGAFLSGGLSFEGGDMWLAQKAILVVGGLFALIFASFHALVDKAKTVGRR